MFREELGDDMRRKAMGLAGIMAVLIVMLLWCGTAMAENGTYAGLDWDVTDNILTLGKVGESQTLADATSREWPWNQFKSSIVEVRCAGPVVLNGSVAGMFSGCSSLTTIDVASLDTSSVTNMSGMFANCGALTSLDVSTFDTTSLQTASGFVSNCTALVSLNMDGWNFQSASNSYVLSSMMNGTSNIKSLSMKNWTHLQPSWTYCFGTGWGGSSNVFEYIDVSNWDLSSVTSLYGVFFNTKVSDIRGLETWNTSTVTNMGYLFMNCEMLSSIDVSNFDTSHVTNLDYMFFQCRALEELDVSNFDVSSASSMNYMFGYLDSLKTLDLSTFDMSNVTSMSYMLSLCDKVEMFVFGPTFRFVGSNSGLNSGFRYLREEDNRILDYSDFNSSWNGSTLYGHYHAIKQAYAILYSNGDCVFQRGDVADPSRGSVIRTVSNIERYGMSNGDGIFNSTYAPQVKRVLIMDDLYPTTTAGWFCGMNNCTAIIGMDKIDTKYTTDMSYMFANCCALTEIDVSNFDTSNVTNMRSMFYRCNHVLELDLSAFDMRNVTQKGSMLSLCSSDSPLPVNAPRIRRLILGENCRIDGTYVSGYLWQNEETMELYGSSSLHGYFEKAFDEDPVALAGSYMPYDEWAIFYENGDLVIQRIYSEDTERGEVVACYDDAYYFRRTDSASPRWPTGYQSDGSITCQRQNIKKIVIRDDIAPFTMYDFFYSLYNLTGIEGLEHLDTSNVVDMHEAFAYCGRDTNGWDLVLPDSFDVSNVTDMYHMFYDCGFTHIVFPEWFDTSEVVRMDNMFYSAKKLKSIDLPEGFTPEKCTGSSSDYSLKYFFDYCEALEYVSLPSTFNASTVRNMKYMFADCPSLKELVLPSSFTTEGCQWTEGLTQFVEDDPSLEYISFPEGFTVSASNDVSGHNVAKNHGNQAPQKRLPRLSWSTSRGRALPLATRPRMRSRSPIFPSSACTCSSRSARSVNSWTTS